MSELPLDAAPVAPLRQARRCAVLWALARHRADSSPDYRRAAAVLLLLAACCAVAGILAG